MKKYGVDEACTTFGIERKFLLRCIEFHWIEPVESPWLDEEDLARAQLILELRDRFGVNDESVPIILHLLDQLYRVRFQLIRLGRAA